MRGCLWWIYTCLICYRNKFKPTYKPHDIGMGLQEMLLRSCNSDPRFLVSYQLGSVILAPGPTKLCPRYAIRRYLYRAWGSYFIPGLACLHASHATLQLSRFSKSHDTMELTRSLEVPPPTASIALRVRRVLRALRKNSGHNLGLPYLAHDSYICRPSRWSSALELGPAANEEPKNLRTL